MTSILAIISNLIVQIISTLGYAGVGFLMALQTIAIPIPSEVILPFAGYLVFVGRFNLWLVALAGALGSCVGATAAYYIGKKGGRPLVEKYGKYILISRHDLDIADKFFEKYGHLSTFIGRMLPVVRTFISLPAGIARVKLVPFLLYSFIGSVIWTYILAFFGMKLGENWGALRNQLHGFDTAIIGLILLFGIYWVYRHIKNSRRA